MLFVEMNHFLTVVRTQDNSTDTAALPDNY